MTRSRNLYGFATPIAYRYGLLAGVGTGCQMFFLVTSLKLDSSPIQAYVVNWKWIGIGVY
jgi:hypothetical protein